MNLNFRQGLISHQSSGFLIPSSTSGYVDVQVSPTPLIFTIAHGTSDYLFKVDASIPAAWGPLVPAVMNHLFVELNVISGEVTFGITSIEPVVSSVEPMTPVAGMMWFDLNETVFKTRNNNNTKWVVTPKIVVGVVPNGNPNQITSKPLGTSVGLNVPGHPGFLMLDSMLRPLRTSSGELLTQDSPVRVRTTLGTSGVLSNPLNSFVPVRANEPIPAMSLVCISGVDAVSLASSNPALVIPKNPIGLIQTSLALNEIGVITQNGEIVSDQWSWAPSDIGKPLYCGFNGELTTVRPSSVQAYRAGYIKSSNSILLQLDAETIPQVLSTPGSVISGVPPISAVTALNGLGEIVTSISMLPADSTTDGYLSSADFTTFSSYDTRISTAEQDIVDLEASKAEVGHQHPMSNIIGLELILNSLNDSLTFKTDKVLLATAGNFAMFDGTGNIADSTVSETSFAASSHTHPISEVDGLQTVLNDKAAFTHEHDIANVVGLQIALDGKALFNHSHLISNVTGLQLALDGKAPSSHTHVIADTTGLQGALDGKASSVHGHAISEIVDLQDELDGKAPVSHNHTAAEIQLVAGNLIDAVNLAAFNSIGVKNIFIEEGNPNNIAIGFGAGLAGLSNSIVIGNSAAAVISGGFDNVIIGFEAADEMTTGARNVIIGSSAGCQIIDSQDNILIGYRAGRQQALVSAPFQSLMSKFILNNEFVRDPAGPVPPYMIGDMSPNSSTLLVQADFSVTDITDNRVISLNTNGSIELGGQSGNAGEVLHSGGFGSAAYWAPPAGGGSALSTLSDVQIVSPAAMDILVYDDITSTWVNSSIPSSGSGLPSGGSTGQVITKSSSGSEVWAIPPGTTFMYPMANVTNYVFDGNYFSDWSVSSRVGTSSEVVASPVTWTGTAFEFSAGGVYEIEIMGIINPLSSATMPDGVLAYGVDLNPSSGASHLAQQKVSFNRNVPVANDINSNQASWNATKESVFAKFVMRIPTGRRFTPRVYALSDVGTEEYSFQCLVKITYLNFISSPPPA